MRAVETFRKMRVSESSFESWKAKHAGVERLRTSLNSLRRLAFCGIL